MFDYRVFTKRLIDLLISTTLLVLTAPIVLVLCIVCYLLEGEKVFFSQKRIGFLNQSFKILKFRTMSPNPKGAKFSVANDPRITKLGRFLRRFKLDELPQLLNVFKGDMSLVGARPILRENFLEFPRKSQFYMFRSNPGITGIASVYFFNEEQILLHSKVNQFVLFYDYLQPFKGELEIWYQKNLSFMTDFKIIFATAWVLFFKDNEILFQLFTDLPKFEIPQPKALEPQLQQVS